MKRALSVVAVAVTLAGCGSDDEGDSTTAADVGEKGSGQAMEGTQPAEIVDDPQGYVSGHVLSPVTNGWRTASTKSFTEVDAGALARDKSTGALAIFRHDFIDISQSTELVEVKGAGTVTITKAPEGKGVVESAQESGKIEFKGTNGVTGTLDLSDDSVSLSGK